MTESSGFPQPSEVAINFADGDEVIWRSGQGLVPPNEMSDLVYGRTPPDNGCQFKRQWLSKYTCRKCGYPRGWHQL